MTKNERLLVLTVDYEIFGNGTGDVRQHIVEPTEKMARACEAAGVPLTIFFEVEEYLAFTRHEPELEAALGYNPARLVREQIQNLARRGHDVQLHIHPQWYGARLVDGQWMLRTEMQTIDDLFSTQREVTEFIGERKAAIETMVATAAPDHRVRVYRAGAFSAQPGQKLIQALVAHEFIIDSSVAVGLRARNATLDLDYRNAPQRRRMWRVRHDVAVEERSGPLWELPIHCEMGRRLNQLTPRRLKAKFSRNVPSERQTEMVEKLGIKRDPIGFLRFLWQPVPIKLDYHNLGPGALLRMIRRAQPPTAQELDVLVLIGHTKEHIDDDSFQTFLQKVVARPGLRVASFTEIANRLRAAQFARRAVTATATTA